MIECPRTSVCPFFQGKLPQMPPTVELIKRRYCFDNHLDCALFVVGEKKGFETLPKDLYPSQRDRALKLLK